MGDVGDMNPHLIPTGLAVHALDRLDRDRVVEVPGVRPVYGDGRQMAQVHAFAEVFAGDGGGLVLRLAGNSLEVPMEAKSAS